MTTDTTIVLVTHDRPDWYREALESALAQRCALVIVDDGSSTDYAKADIRFEVPVGLARARLAGLGEVGSTFVSFLDDDDVLGPDWLSSTREVMEEGFDVVATSFVETDENLNRLRTYSLPVPTMAGLLSGNNPVNDGALIRCSVLEGVRWHAERRSALMFSLWLDLMARGARFGVVPDAWLWFRRLHDDNMSASLGVDDARWRAEAIAEHTLVPA